MIRVPRVFSIRIKNPHRYLSSAAPSPSSKPDASEFTIRTSTSQISTGFQSPLSSHSCSPSGFPDFSAIINFSHFLQSNTLLEKQQSARAVVDALSNRGFLYLSHHGIPSDEITKTFQASSQFFSTLTSDQKHDLAWKDPRSNRGYVASGRERVTQSASAEEIQQLRKKAPDFKESLEIGRERDPGDVEPKWMNQWPSKETVSYFTSVSMIETVRLSRQCNLGNLLTILSGCSLFS